MNTRQTPQYEHKKSISPLAAGLTGLLLGVAGATAIALSDEEVRKKASKKAKEMKTNLQKWGSHKLRNIKQRREEARKEVNEVKNDTAEEIKEMEV